VIVFGLYMLATRWVGDWVNERLTAGIAHATAGVLRALGNDAFAQGSMVAVGPVQLRIIGECTAVHVMALFAAAVIAFPANWKNRLAGIAFGLTAIQLVNLIRMTSLYYVIARWPEHFETAHLVVWQSLMVLVAILLWALWAAAPVFDREASAA
jgi:exosortase/archaeosortase family protein